MRQSNPNDHIWIVGIGSAHGDDQIGWRLVERLQPLLNDDRYRYLCSDKPLADLWPLLTNKETIWIIDAAVDNAVGSDAHGQQQIEQGAIPSLREVSLLDLCVHPAATLSTHAQGVAEVLQLSQVVHGSQPALRLLAIEADPLWSASDLSPPLQAQFSHLLNQIMRYILQEAC